MLWIVLSKTVPNTAASQTSVDWGHDEARTGGTARIPFARVARSVRFSRGGVQTGYTKVPGALGKDAHRRTVPIQCRASNAGARSRRF